MTHSHSEVFKSYETNVVRKKIGRREGIEEGGQRGRKEERAREEGGGGSKEERVRKEGGGGSKEERAREEGGGGNKEERARKERGRAKRRERGRRGGGRLGREHIWKGGRTFEGGRAGLETYHALTIHTAVQNENSR